MGASEAPNSSDGVFAPSVFVSLRNPGALSAVLANLWGVAINFPGLVLFAAVSSAMVVGLVVGVLVYRRKTEEFQARASLASSDPLPEDDDSGQSCWVYKFGFTSEFDVARRGSGVDLPALANLSPELPAPRASPPRRRDYGSRRVHFVENRNTVFVLPPDQRNPALEMLSWFYPVSAGESFGPRDGLLAV